MQKLTNKLRIKWEHVVITEKVQKTIKYWYEKQYLHVLLL